MFGARHTEDSMLAIVPLSMGTPTLIEAFLGTNCYNVLGAVMELLSNELGFIMWIAYTL